jgi:hypothetical protein
MVLLLRHPDALSFNLETSLTLLPRFYGGVVMFGDAATAWWWPLLCFDYFSQVVSPLSPALSRAL